MKQFSGPRLPVGNGLNTDDLLQPRIVTNLGLNTVFLDPPDINVKAYLRSAGAPAIAERIILKPMQSVLLLNFHVVMLTDDGNAGKINHNFDVGEALLKAQSWTKTQ